ncbi:MAG: helix-turn-helix transcriptional regulator [Gammaproteobacteria bacterium]|nr:helix-turn-helix transcriptional regulator [Gammaproteobacteria bacterium]
MKSYKTKKIGDKRYRCFFELTLSVIGGKWKPIILYKLAREGTLRFSDLRRQIREVTERMLSRQLRELEHDGLIHREVYKQVPPKVEYSLTKLGSALIPILLSLRQWGVAYEEYLGGDSLFLGEEYEPRDHPRSGGLSNEEVDAN